MIWNSTREFSVFSYENKVPIRRWRVLVAIKCQEIPAPAC